MTPALAVTAQDFFFSLILILTRHRLFESQISWKPWRSRYTAAFLHFPISSFSLDLVLCTSPVNLEGKKKSFSIVVLNELDHRKWKTALCDVLEFFQKQKKKVHKLSR